MVVGWSAILLSFVILDATIMQQKESLSNVDVFPANQHIIGTLGVSRHYAADKGDFTSSVGLECF